MAHMGMGEKNPLKFILLRGCFFLKRIELLRQIRRSFKEVFCLSSGIDQRNRGSTTTQAWIFPARHAMLLITTYLWIPSILSHTQHKEVGLIISLRW